MVIKKSLHKFKVILTHAWELVIEHDDLSFIVSSILLTILIWMIGLTLSFSVDTITGFFALLAIIISVFTLFIS